MFSWNKDRLYNKTFIFIAGVEGSGTTMLLEFLAQPSFAVSLGGLYVSPGYKRHRKKIRAASGYFWDITEKRTPQEIEEKKEIIRNIKIPKNITHLVFKRSFPFGEVKNLPNLVDVLDFAHKVKIVVIDRSLKSCVASIRRREFTPSIEESAQRIKKGRIHLEQGLANIDKKYYEVFSYEDFIKDPHAYLDRLESFLEYPKGSLAPFVSSTIRRPTKEAQDILQEHSAFLEQFFSDFANKLNET